MRDIINKIVEILITALEPILISVVDIITATIEVERQVIKNVTEAESNFMRNIFCIIKNKSTIENASKIYYIFLIFIDILLIGSIFKGKIFYIQVENLIIYIIMFILFILSILNLLLKHSKFNNRLKVFSIVQVLVIIPILIAYWIVSIEGRGFYLKELDIDQWSSIFNNIIIYFATCTIGVVSSYKSIIDKR